jgi:ATP-dependent DNA ligase
LDGSADDAVLDGEIVKLDENGRPCFVDLIRRSGPFVFVAFDALGVNGKDLRTIPLWAAKESPAASVKLGALRTARCPPGP